MIQARLTNAAALRTIRRLRMQCFADARPQKNLAALPRSH